MFVKPPFLENESSSQILSRMLSSLPDTISKEENGWICDLFSPVALEKARAVEFVLTEAVKNIVPLYSYGRLLKEHAANRGIVPKPAQCAVCELFITAREGTVIPEGSLFSTASSAELEGIIFAVKERAIVPKTGEITVLAVCTHAGSAGNVPPETVILMVKPIQGIRSVSNPKGGYGGYDGETEESLRNRIVEYDRSQGKAFVGCAGDYRRWALEVTGTGGVKVIPAQTDDGMVTLIITDSNGDAASETLCKQVYNHIMRPDSLYDRLAPCNALLQVIPPQTVSIGVNAVCILKEGYSIEAVKKEFTSSLKKYLKTQQAQTIVRYAEIGALLVHTEGILDYTALTIAKDQEKGGTQNIVPKAFEMPVTEETVIQLELQV